MTVESGREQVSIVERDQALRVVLGRQSVCEFKMSLSLILYLWRLFLTCGLDVVYVLGARRVLF